MKNRNIEMLLQIVENPSINLHQLANYFNVSTRSVRNDLIRLNSYLTENNLQNIQLNRDGTFTFDNEDVYSGLNLLQKSNLYEYHLSKEERETFMLERIMMNRQEVTLKDMCQMMCVSYSTAQSDLKSLKKTAEKYSLKLESQPYKGVQIIGSETDKRHLIFDELNQQLKLPDIHFTYGFAKIPEVICRYEQMQGTFLTDKSFVKLANYLTVIIIRIRNGFEIEKAEEVAEYKEDVDILSGFIKDEFQIEMSREENAKLSEILSKLRYTRKKAIENDTVMIQIFVRRFTENISKALHVDLTDDYILFSKLSFHVGSMINQEIIEPMNDSIINDLGERYIHTEAIVKNEINVLEELLERKITENEIKFIVLHVCAALERKDVSERNIRAVMVSNLSAGAIQCISGRLFRTFDISIIDVIPLHLVAHYNFANFDLILSDTHLNIPDKPCVQVSELLDWNQLANIYHAVGLILKPKKKAILSETVMGDIQEIAKHYRIDDPEGLMNELHKLLVNTAQNDVHDPEYYQQLPLSLLLPVSCIQLNLHAEDWRDSIRQCAEVLLKNGSITERYRNAMIAGIERNGPYVVLGNGFAVPHAGIDDGARRTGFAFAVLKNPVDYGSSLGKVKYVVCLSAVDAKSHMRAFMSLVNMISKEDFCSRLAKAASAQEIHDLIREYE